MSPSISVTAVFDIGKTNKKFLLFDEQFNVVFKSHESPGEIRDEDGYPCEDLGSLVSWIHDQLARACADDKFDIQALNFSTYGASFVHVDENDNVVTPLYNYLKPYPEELLEQLYNTHGHREKFSLETASPPMGMLNSGLQLYWLKQTKPDLFGRIRYSFHFPNYLSYLFSNTAVSELTSIGCHTGMWNFQNQAYHEWLSKEGLMAILPGIQPAVQTADGFFGTYRFRTGTGIHDSSSALVPYLYGIDDPFMLLSTGTWNIAMHPFNNEPLTYEELEKDCLCYINIHGDPVKSARFFLGHEYDHQKKKLVNHFGRDDELKPDPAILKKLIDANDASKKIELETSHTSGPWPQKKPGNWRVEKFDSYEEAYHQLILDLVSIQADSVRLAMGNAKTNRLIVTGGFSHNPAFLQILAAYFEDIGIYTDSLSHASALGAAMVIQDRPPVAGQRIEKKMNLSLHEPLVGTGIEQYRWRE